MDELEQLWPQLLDAAATKAVAEGRHDLAEYLRLKAMNDAIRTTASNWILNSLIELASPHLATRGLKIDIVEPFSFRVGNSTMVGRAAELTEGVRKLTVSTGWPRQPSHGILRGGALAHARFVHFGLPKAGVELRLLHTHDLPAWIDENNVSIGVDLLAHHLGTFFG